MIEITKDFAFEGAHALRGYDGKCSHIHGHSYKLSVTVQGEPLRDSSSPKNGMVIDFTDLKKIVAENILSKFDHALVLSTDAPLAQEINKEYGNIVITDFTPTSENLVEYFAMLILEKLPKGVILKSVKLYETATCCAEWKNIQ